MEYREGFEIREGRRDDAPFLAETVMEAVGHELCVGLAGGEGRLPLVRQLFEALAARDDSQYSHRNSFVAVDARGEAVGAVIAYDGAELRRLRMAFAQEANHFLGWNVTPEEAAKWEDEADSGEIYIDSLYVRPEYRGKGLASDLLKAVESRFGDKRKPLGLLVEPENGRAREVYGHWGFREKGVSHFFRAPMLHMQKDVTPRALPRES